MQDCPSTREQACLFIPAVSHLSTLGSIWLEHPPWLLYLQDSVDTSTKAQE